MPEITNVPTNNNSINESDTESEITHVSNSDSDSETEITFFNNPLFRSVINPENTGYDSSPITQAITDDDTENEMTDVSNSDFESDNEESNPNMGNVIVPSHSRLT
jgi:hypothetical protein